MKPENAQWTVDCEADRGENVTDWHRFCNRSLIFEQGRLNTL